MKTLKTTTISSLLMTVTIFGASLYSVVSLGAGGVGGPGGGDVYVIDFVRIASQEVHPWLVDYGNTLQPPVDPTAFIMALNSKEIVSVANLYESCLFKDGENGLQAIHPIGKTDSTDPARAACYNPGTGLTYLSRSMYPLNSDTSSKRALITHEILRRMRLNDDQYQISSQMPILKENGDDVTCFIYEHPDSQGKILGYDVHYENQAVQNCKFGCVEGGGFPADQLGTVIQNLRQRVAGKQQGRDGGCTLFRFTRLNN